MTLHHLPNTRLTPEVLLHATLAHKDETQALVILETDKNGKFSVALSNMTTEQLAFFAQMFQVWISDLFAGRSKLP